MTKSTLAALGIIGIAIATVALAAPPAAVEEPATTSTTDGVVAFYFHGNVRCATCRKIEAFTDEAIHSGFGKALENGSLAWSVVNVDDPLNKHFIEDFQLVTRSVVLAEYRDGNVVRWKNLNKVWLLVRDQDAFADYIRGETNAFLGES